MKFRPHCAKCPGMYCVRNSMENIEQDVLPDACPMKLVGETIQTVVKEYEPDTVQKVYVPATIVEKEAYEVVRGVRRPVRPRIRELIEFAKRADIKTIGIAFCIMLRDEAMRVTSILEDHEFEVASVLCKCGGVDKTRLGVPAEHKMRGASVFEAGCNPILQARLLEMANTEINVIVGLCIGHDMLFTSHSKAPVTTFIVKDRYTGHNPVISLYTRYHQGMVRSKTYGI